MNAADDIHKDEGSTAIVEQETPYNKRKKLNPSGPLPEISLRKLIPPKDSPRIRRPLHIPNNSTATLQQQLVHANDFSSQASVPLFDWSAVITRARSHPHEAAEPYFGPPILDTTNSSSTDSAHASSASAANATSSSKISSSSTTNIDILTYKPLHAMLKYDPPLDAVEAVLRAHPEAVLDVTFEGSALKIAAECSRVSSMFVLRLLLVAEMAMRKKLNGRKEKAELEKSKVQQQDNVPTSNAKDSDNIPAQQHQQELMFYGHNPIRWITERRIPVKTAAMLLKWYPNGAFQRSSPCDEDASCYSPLPDHVMEESTSPLIDIVDDFAREDTDDAAGGNNGDCGDYDSETDYDDGVLQSSSELPYTMTAAEAITETTTTTATSEATTTTAAQTAMRPQTYKERRWEKFLHILYATDLALQSITSSHSTNFGGEACSSPLQNSNTTDSAKTATPDTTESSTVVAADPSLSKNNESSEPSADASSSSPMTPPTTTSNNSTNSQQPKQPPQFRPVHAFLRCLTTPHCNIGLHHCRPYGAWSVLCVMALRIPSEFAKRDAGDGYRTAFQTLAESDARDCKLCLEEVKDVVECLMDADYRSAFLPRKSDGRLIGHVALENGWPCKDLFSRKASATCA